MLVLCLHRLTPTLTKGCVRRLHVSAIMAKRRTYADAVTALNSIQTNYAIIEQIRASGKSKNKEAIPEMIEWCRKAGFAPADLDRLNAIHIAGTKGKGSTSAFISSILGQYLNKENNVNEKATSNTNGEDRARPPTKLGLYTSPHLRYVRERIQLDGTPISEQSFADVFFEVWDSLDEAARADGLPVDQKAPKPVYFRFLTLMAFHMYLSRGVDTAIIECGIGGEFDSTNVLQRPSVVGITSLGIDHTAVLGGTIEEIAWHKAGIMKPGSAVYTVPQPEGAVRVLEERAKEKGVELYMVPVHPEIAEGKVSLGLQGEFQKINASLAVELAAAHLRKLGHKDISTVTLPKEFVTGLQSVQWGGRCETRQENNLTWYLDGAHTVESIEAASQWFADCVLQSQQQFSGRPPSPATPGPRVLLFNQQARAGGPLLRKIHQTLSSKLTNESHLFTHVIFCTNVTFADSGYRPDLVSMNTSSKEVEALEVQHALAKTWHTEIDPETDVQVVGTIDRAVQAAREIAGRHIDRHGDDTGGAALVFVVGSVHLVGGVLEVLESKH